MKEFINVSNRSGKNIFEQYYYFFSEHEFQTNDYSIFLSSLKQLEVLYNSTSQFLEPLLITDTIDNSLSLIYKILEYQYFKITKKIYDKFTILIKFYILILDNGSKLYDTELRYNVQNNLTCMEEPPMKYASTQKESQRKFLNKFNNDIARLKNKGGNIYSNGRLLKHFIIDQHNNIKIDSITYYIDVTLNVSTKSRLSNLFATLWKIIQALELFENVNVELQSISKGSLIAELRIWAKDLVAKKNLKDGLVVAREIAVKYLSGGNVSYVQTSKTTSEIENIQLENRLKEIEINERKTQDELEIMHMIELQQNLIKIEMGILEKERMEIENKRAQIDLENSRIDLLLKAHELLARGFLDSEKIELFVNDIIFLKRSENDFAKVDINIDPF